MITEWHKPALTLALSLSLALAACARADLRNQPPGPGAGGVDAVGGSTHSTGSIRPTSLVDYLGNPDYPDDFWVAWPPERSGLDASLMQLALERIDAEGWELHSFLVAWRGRLVFERYGYNRGLNAAVPQPPHQTVPTEPPPAPMRRVCWFRVTA